MWSTPQSFPSARDDSFGNSRSAISTHRLLSALLRLCPCRAFAPSACFRASARVLLLAAEAKERQESEGRKRGNEGGRGNTKPSGPCGPKGSTPRQPEAPRARDKAASVVGVSGRTVARVAALAEAAKTNPAAKAAFDVGDPEPRRGKCDN